MLPAPLDPTPPPIVGIPATTENSFNALCDAIRAYNTPQTASETAGADEQGIPAAEILSHRFAGILNQMGLTLSAKTGNQDATNARPIIQIEDPKAFAAFLDSLTGDTFTETQFGSNLANLPALLAVQVRAISDLVDPSDRTLTLLASLNPVVNAYARLGLKHACAELQPYADKVREKILADYLLVERLELLMPPGLGFSPGDRQFDSYPSTLNKKWKQALDTLDALGKKETTTELHGSVSRHLEALVTAARANIGRVPFERRDEVAEILESAHRKLLPLCSSTNTVHAVDAAPLREALSGLQYRTALPHLIAMRDLYFRDATQENRVSANATHNANGQLLAHVCAGKAHIAGEAEIMTFAVEPTVRGLGLEVMVLTELEAALKKMEFAAMRITLAGSDPALAIVKGHYGKAAQVVGSYGDDQRVLRISFGQAV